MTRGDLDRYYSERVKLKERSYQTLLRPGELSGKNVNDRSEKDMGMADESPWIFG